MMCVDERYMHLARNVAEIARGQTSPNPLVGAVVVKDGRVVGQGAHLQAGGPHAEVHALRMAGDMARGATIYVTLEPCNHHGRTPPCTEAIINAGIRRVVVGSVDVNPLMQGKGLKRLSEAGIEVVTGVLATETDRLNEAFFHYMVHKRPLVVWKCAATMDGYIAACSGHSEYVSGEVARAEVQSLRREIPAIAVGIGTVLADNPRLTVRDESGPAPATVQPLRVVFDSQLRMPETARLLHEPGRAVVLTTELSLQHRAGKANVLQSINGTSVIGVESQNERISLPAAFHAIGQLGITSLLLEGGTTLATACLEAHLIDKVIYYIAPKLLSAGIRALNGTATQHMSDAVSLRDVTHRSVGDNLCIEGYPVYQ